jgi:hypothetical protein
VVQRLSDKVEGRVSEVVFARPGLRERVKRLGVAIEMFAVEA